MIKQPEQQKMSKLVLGAYFGNRKFNGEMISSNILKGTTKKNILGCFQ